MPQLNKSQIAEAKECYSIYGRRDGIPIAELGNALRSLGINPTNAEIKNIIVEIGSPPSVNYEMFMVSLQPRMVPQPGRFTFSLVSAPKDLFEKIIAHEVILSHENISTSRITVYETK